MTILQCQILNENFDPINWVNKEITRELILSVQRPKRETYLEDIRSLFKYTPNQCAQVEEEGDNTPNLSAHHIEIFGQQVEVGTCPALQHNSATQKELA
jgi:hypothetical protein